MKTLADPDGALTRGLESLRSELALPSGFPPAVLEAAQAAAARFPSDHVDRTGVPFVTLDPAAATDLDQAFAIERAGGDLILYYAIADVGWFVADGDLIDAEAWRRGTTLYFPDGRISLYPPVVGEGAASLLPDGERPAVIFAVRIDSAGQARLDGVERAIIRSRAKLAYENVQPAQLPADFRELARRVQAAEAERGASRVDPPEQEVSSDDDGGYELAFRPRTHAEDDNAALSLAANLAVADALLAHGTGLFRVMAGPEEGGIQRLRRTAHALASIGPENRPWTRSNGRSIPPTRPMRPSCWPCGAPVREHPTLPFARARSHGTRRWRPPMPMRPRRCGGSPTAMSSRPRWRSPMAVRFRCQRPRRSNACPR